MKFVIQCTTQASVTIDQKLYSEIGKGFLVLIGICDEDTKETADKMIRKLIGMRIFSDENGKTNLALKDVDGQLLLVSQFTLYADCKKGNRPSFVKAGSPQHANELYEYIIDACKKEVPVVKTGVFGAEMEVALINDGPFTIILDSKDLSWAYKHYKKRIQITESTKKSGKPRRQSSASADICLLNSFLSTPASLTNVNVKYCAYP